MDLLRAAIFASTLIAAPLIVATLAARRGYQRAHAMTAIASPAFADMHPTEPTIQCPLHRAPSIARLMQPPALRAPPLGRCRVANSGETDRPLLWCRTTAWSLRLAAAYLACRAVRTITPISGARPEQQYALLPPTSNRAPDPGPISLHPELRTDRLPQLYRGSPTPTG